MKDNVKKKEKRDEQSYLWLCSIVVVGMEYLSRCSVRWVSSGCGWEGAMVEEDGWWWKRNESNVNRDAVDVTLKLHSPTKITFDTDIYQPDNKIKI